MSNLVGRTYGAVDGALMYGANKAVRSWNWTTGETKAELANGMLGVASVLECSGAFAWSALLGSIVLPFSLVGTHIYQLVNENCENNEVKSLESKAKNVEAEDYKKSCEFDGSFYAFLAAGGLSAGGTIGLENKSGTTSVLAGTGIAFRGASCYVMRTDYLPPRKNCVRRGLEKLEKVLEGYKAKPVLVRA